MSAFIGPIHYWLYGKIRLVTDREEFIYNKAAEICGSTAEELREQVMQSFGVPLPDVDLGELIDHDNIHGWLQRQIKIAESREAAFVNELLSACGDTAQEMLAEAFADHGKQTGEQAQSQTKYNLTTAPGIYKALNDYYLNGMPCDQGDMVVNSTPDSMVWDSAVCLHEPNWKRAGVNPKTMAALYRNWLAGFVSGANNDFSFRQASDCLAGDSKSRYEINRQ